MNDSVKNKADEYEQLSLLISDHPFCNTYIGYTQTEATLYDPPDYDEFKVQLWDPTQHPEAWDYLSRVGSCFFNLASVISEMQLTMKMIYNAEQISELMIQKVSEIVRFGTAVWITRFCTAYEIVLQLIAEVFDLGYTGRTVSKGNLQGNRHISGNAGIKEILANLHKLLKTKIENSGEERNLENLNNSIKHLNEFSIDQISKLWFLEWSSSIDDGKNPIDAEIDRGLVRHELLNQLEGLTKDIIVSIEQSLNYLNPLFDQKFLELRSEGK